MARSSVDLPLPFSPAKKVTGEAKSREEEARRISRLNG
jgi:hypothetical protein